MPRKSKHGCRSGERFSPYKKKKGGSGCYVPTKSGKKRAKKPCSKGFRRHSKSGQCMKPCKMPYRRMSKSPYHCRLTKKMKKRTTSGGVAFLA